MGNGGNAGAAGQMPQGPVDNLPQQTAAPTQNVMINGAVEPPFRMPVGDSFGPPVGMNPAGMGGMDGNLNLERFRNAASSINTTSYPPQFTPNQIPYTPPQTIAQPMPMPVSQPMPQQVAQPTQQEMQGMQQRAQQISQMQQQMQQMRSAQRRMGNAPQVAPSMPQSNIPQFLQTKMSPRTTMQSYQPFRYGPQTPQRQMPSGIANLLRRGR